MTTKELRANLTKTHEIIHAAFHKLCVVSIDLPKDSEKNVVRLPVAATTAHDISDTLEYMRDCLLTDEKDNERQLSSDELKKICVMICKHLWLVCDLIEDIQRALAVDDSDYGTDLWVLSTAIAEMIGKFQQKDEE